jgi:hypothetical protein
VERLTHEMVDVCGELERVRDTTLHQQMTMTELSRERDEATQARDSAVKQVQFQITLVLLKRHVFCP